MQMERTIQKMLQQLLANQEKVKANRKANLEQMLANKGKVEANRKDDREQMETYRKANLENLKRMMKEMLRTNQDGLKEMTACNEVTETEPKPGMIQSKEEHQEIPKGEAAVIPVGGPRKRHRVQNLAAERCQKRKERTQGNSGSRRKSAAASKKVSRLAKVAWQKRNLFRRTRTQEKCGSWKRVNKVFHDINRWFTINLSLNVDKTQIMQFVMKTSSLIDLNIFHGNKK
jgi:hypothetical protein